MTAWQGKINGSGSIDIATQDQIVAAIRARAAASAPVCSGTGEKKVPVDFEFEPDSSGNNYHLGLRVWYACCRKLF